MTGPNLAHLQSRSVFAGSTYELTETNLRQWIQDTQSMKPGNDMNINLKSSDIDNVIAYLKLLK
jgi:cytochrome c oxidase subunit 2